MVRRRTSSLGGAALGGTPTYQFTWWCSTGWYADVPVHLVVQHWLVRRSISSPGGAALGGMLTYQFTWCSTGWYADIPVHMVVQRWVVCRRTSSLGCAALGGTQSISLLGGAALGDMPTYQFTWWCSAGWYADVPVHLVVQRWVVC